MKTEEIAERIANNIKLNDVLYINRSYAPGTADHYRIDRSKVVKMYGTGFRFAPRSAELDDMVIEILEERLEDVLWNEGITR